MTWWTTDMRIVHIGHVFKPQRSPFHFSATHTLLVFTAQFTGVFLLLLLRRYCLSEYLNKVVVELAAYYGKQSCHFLNIFVTVLEKYVESIVLTR